MLERGGHVDGLRWGSGNRASRQDEAVTFLAHFVERLGEGGCEARAEIERGSFLGLRRVGSGQHVEHTGVPEPNHVTDSGARAFAETDQLPALLHLNLFDQFSGELSESVKAALRRRWGKRVLL